MMWEWAPWSHWLSMAGVWVLGITGIVWAVATLFPTPPRQDAQRILDERLARGELDVEEYRRRSDELHAHARPTDRTRA